MVWAMLLGFAQTSFADVPDHYYQSIDGKKKVELKKALQNIIKKHYVAKYKELWNWYETTDVVPGTTNQVFDYYSDVVEYFPEPSNMNKEHACPQSWWGSGASCDCYSDLFNVMPSNSNANSAKSNYPVGVVKSSNITYSNPRMKVGSSARSQYEGKVFEPCDEYKGDFARIYFYVATCYADAAWGSNTNVASTCAFTQQDYPTVKPWILDLLLEWHHADPPSEWEVIRNERVYSVQTNRNPFIDYPQLADYIWGDSIDYAFDLSTALVNGGADYGQGTGEGGNTGDGGDTGGGTGDGGDTGGDTGGGDTGDGGSDINVEVGTVLIDEPFDDITEGNDNSNTGANAQWSGNDNFPNVVTAYKAGGAVKLGSSKNPGSITSRTIAYQGGPLAVRVKVKGWTAVEGELQISASGAQLKSVAYEATMTDAYEEHTVVFDSVAANPIVSIATSTKRAFITEVTVFVPETTAIRSVETEKTDSPATFLNLYGQKVSNIELGNIYLVNGRKVVVQ